MSQEDNNKLIAEFMGTSYTNRSIPNWAFILKDFDMLGYGGYEYKTSIDWLMPVIDKIESKGYWTEMFGGKGNGMRIGVSGNINAIIQSFGKNRIETYYDCILQFIKWFNEQPETIEL